MNDWDTISYYVYEEAMVRAERHLKRQIAVIILLLIALIGTNAGWLWYESQFADVETEVTQEADASDGGNAYLFGEKAGAVIYGTSETDN